MIAFLRRMWSGIGFSPKSWGVIIFILNPAGEVIVNDNGTVEEGPASYKQ